MADPGALTGTPACRNCGAPVPENFCTRCGPHRDAGVVSLRSMWAELVEDQLTLGALLFRPGWPAGLKTFAILLVYPTAIALVAVGAAIVSFFLV